MAWYADLAAEVATCCPVFGKLPACTQHAMRLMHCMLCRQLEVVEGPLVDLEVRGVPALQYFGNRVWQ